MKIAVVGSGYVGLVVGGCLAESGNDVICADIDQDKIDRLKRGEIPIYEPGLEPLIAANLKARRLSFTTDVPQAVSASDVVFIAVGTPPDEDGSADLQHVLAVARTIGESMHGEKIVITKSTVPVGTAKHVRDEIESRTKHKVHVCSNPEFLKEGAAIEDFMKPDRVVLGVDSEYAAEVLRDLYAPFVRTGREILIMDVPSAEITKYAANSMLATRISFMNSIAQLCEKAGADVNAVRRGIGSDSRIGWSFLFPGVGYGGSCLTGEETVLARFGGEARLMTLDALFEECAVVPSGLPGEPEPEVAWVNELEVLSWGEESGAEWRRAPVVTRRWYEGDVALIRTKMGRRLRCTTDHPLVVSDGCGAVVGVKLAGEICEDDWLPIAMGRPNHEATREAELSLVAGLGQREFADGEVIVRLSPAATQGLDLATTREAVADHPRGRHRAYDILRTGALRLHEMRRLDLPLGQGTYGTARNGTYVPASLKANVPFWRIVGLYLAEGHCTQDGRRMRLQWSFHPTDEAELVEEVAGYWRGLGVTARVWQGTTTRLVSISSRILARWWLRELRLGGDCYTHQIPDAAWALSAEEQIALLSGLWHGDGSWSLVAGGPSVVLEWATVSRVLADGVLRLLGGLGICARLKVARTAKSTTDTYWVVVCGADQVERLIELVKPADRTGVLTSIGRQSKRIAPTGYRSGREAAWVRVVEHGKAAFRGWVYSLEVPGTHTFVTTGGLIVHNCFPKDVQALASTMSELGVDPSILQAVEHVNQRQKRILLERLVDRLGEDLTGRTVGVWGLAFKPNTDDMREAPSIATIEGLLERGARVVAHDPVAMREARHRFGDRVEFADVNYDALHGASALVIHTEWHPYRRPDFERMLAAMERPLVLDGRNLYDPDQMAERGFEYVSIGRTGHAGVAVRTGRSG